MSSGSARFAFLVRLVPLGMAVLLGIFLLGLRWGYIGRFGMDLPVADQWDAEGSHLLMPLQQHRPLLPEIFHSHNEHRVVLTKLVNLTLTVLNGSWDQRLESVFNALLPAVLAALLFLHGRRVGPPLLLPVLWLLLAFAWGSPLSWQNMVSGFHSQQLFLIGLSYGAIAGLAAARPWTRRWWVGAVCAVLALGSMASGFFASLVVVGLLAVRLRRGEVTWSDARPALGVALAVLLVGAASRVNVDYHEVLKAHTLRDFWLTLVYGLQWPAPSWAGWAALMWAPWTWLAVVVLRRPRGPGGADGWVLLGLGGWVLLQLLATAYARGAGGEPPPTRYFDTLIIGIITNFLALGWLAARPAVAAPRARSIVLGALGSAWLATVAWGTLPHLRQSRAEMIASAAVDQVAATNTRFFLLTNDTRHIETNAVPYPEYRAYVPRISDPSLRRLMPTDVRPPLEVMTATAQGFTQEKLNGRPDVPTPALPPSTPPLLYEPFWSSWHGTGAANTGEWTSTTIRTGRGWIEIRVTGTGDASAVTLEIRDAWLGTVLAVLPPPAQSGTWEKHYVRVPGHGFVIAAQDRSATGWLAFSAPVEVNTLSYWAIAATRLGWTLAAWAAGGALLLSALALLPVVFPRLVPPPPAGAAR